MENYILAHDLGTSGNKATLYDLSGNLVDSIVSQYQTYYPHEGWVEQKATDWWKAVCDSSKYLLEKAGISASDIATVCFSGMMMGCLLIDKNGDLIRDAMIWADIRSSKQELFMKSRVSMERGYRITGHRLSASYSAAKLLWIKDNEPQNYKRAYKMLNAKDYIVYKFTGELVTDYSDASGTNLLDITKLEWSDELLEAFEIDKSILPEIVHSTQVVGKVTVDAAKESGLLEGTPIVIGGGDGSCACVGARIVREGDTYNVIGSSSWVSMAAKQPYFDPDMRTFNWVHLDNSLYTPCGTMQAAGYSYSWYKDVLSAAEHEQAKREEKNIYSILDAQAELSVPGAGGILYLPYLLGERSPHWNHNARGAFVGMGISTTKNDFTRSVLEGVGFNLKIIIETLEQFHSIDKIVMIGGGAKGETWLRILANIWQKELQIPEYLEEATSMGAAICGGVGIGVFKDFSVATKFNRITKTISPDPELANIYSRYYKAFNSAYEGLIPAFDLLAEI